MDANKNSQKVILFAKILAGGYKFVTLTLMISVGIDPTTFRVDTNHPLGQTRCKADVIATTPTDHVLLEKSYLKILSLTTGPLIIAGVRPVIFKVKHTNCNTDTPCRRRTR